MNSQELLYLSKRDVESVNLPMKEIIGILLQMFEEKGHGRVEMPPKPGIHPLPDAFIHAMPALIPSMKSAGIKWVSGFPQNQAKGLPYITGLMMLNEPETGIPYAVMDCTWITAKRTGAATAVAAKYLARPESSTVGILACGVQGRSNLEALKCIFPLTRVKAYDVNAEVAYRFAKEMSQELELEIEVVEKPELAVRKLDIVVTSGPILKNPSPVIEPDWLAPGSFASPVDFDSYWTGAALRQGDRIATDDHAQMKYYRQVGYFKETPEPYADLGELVTGKKPGRQSADERTFSINLGIALEDMATAPLVYRRALEMGIGTRLPL
jgi:ornithine cyclodeaminase/alanine dehydrogenase-like protein (mu-crystallin family)